MKNKVILITVDGMRPDGFLACGHPFADEMMRRGAYTLNASSMIPPVTLPCHLSVFRSVPPQRHGTLTNTYVQPVHAVKGLMEQIHDIGGSCAMFYGWGPIREVAQAKSLLQAEYLWAYAHEHTDGMLTDRAIRCMKEEATDFVFLYLVETDEKGGHDNGWMSEAYLSRIHYALGCVQRVLDAAAEEYTVIVIADHGGHDRSHGMQIPEDMTIPVFAFGPAFKPGRILENVTLLDIAPTVADLMGIPCVREWEGKSFVRE